MDFFFTSSTLTYSNRPPCKRLYLYHERSRLKIDSAHNVFIQLINIDNFTIRYFNEKLWECDCTGSAKSVFICENDGKCFCFG